MTTPDPTPNPTPAQVLTAETPAEQPERPTPTLAYYDVLRSWNPKAREIWPGEAQP